MGEPGDGFQAEAPRGVIPFNPRANEALATRNGFARGGNTGIPCVGGTGFHVATNALFERGWEGIHCPDITEKADGCLSWFTSVWIVG